MQVARSSLRYEAKKAQKDAVVRERMRALPRNTRVTGTDVFGSSSAAKATR
jgi:hypothetical protein